VPSTGATRCTLSAAHTQRLLSKGTILASADCATSLEAELSGRLTVRVANHGAHGEHAKGSTVHSYTLKGTRVNVLAGHQIEVHLRLSLSSLRTVLEALEQHRRVGLYLTLASVRGTTPTTHTHMHRPSIVIARHDR
jgi:hypothetical protein